MIKIGIECENLEDPKSRWGVGQVTLNLLKEYADNLEWQKKYKLYLYFKKKVPDDDIFKIQNSKFKIRVLGFPSFNIFYHILMPLRAMADRLDWMFFPAYQLPPLYIGKSVVMLTHDVYYEYKYGDLPFRYKLSYGIFTNWAAKFATKILAISETSKKEVARVYKINHDKIFVSYLGVSSHNPQSVIRNSKLGNYILYIGQMFPRRHARETILAFKKVITEHSNILQNIGMLNLKLILVGQDKYNPPQIKELIKNINKELDSEKIIHYDYIEKREDLEKLYAGAKALVYVSDREAFGLPPMEALSLGVPPVIADNELGHELFGDYAFYSLKENNPSEALAKEGSMVDSIADAIRRALTDEQKISKIKSEGFEFEKKYSWKSFAYKFFDNVKK